jgi:chloramphenicol 3-O-phosphotransferase
VKDRLAVDCGHDVWVVGIVASGDRETERESERASREAAYKF